MHERFMTNRHVKIRVSHDADLYYKTNYANSIMGNSRQRVSNFIVALPSDLEKNTHTQNTHTTHTHANTHKQTFIHLFIFVSFQRERVYKSGFRGGLN